MFCSKCGAQNNENAKRCASCNAELVVPDQTTTPRFSTVSLKAVFSLVLGILGCFYFFSGLPIIIPVILGRSDLLFNKPHFFFIPSILPGISALILGIMAIKDIRRKGGALSGASAAVGGISLGVLCILIFILGFPVPLFLEYRLKSRVSKVKKDQSTLATAIHGYFKDTGSYPDWGVQEKGANFKAPRDSDIYKLPSFRKLPRSPEKNRLNTLTSPVAYIKKYPKDPFADAPGATYVYYQIKEAWILISPGPDREYNIDPFIDFTSTLTLDSSRLSEKCYDPTNGAVSPGDIFRMKIEEGRM